MYKCKDCGKEFRFPKKALEKHGFKSPPYEELRLCPICGSHKFFKKPEFYCKYCGTKISKDEDYCSLACQKKGEEAYARDAERRRRMKEDPLMCAVREVELFNRTSGKRLSYGEYFAGSR